MAWARLGTAYRELGRYDASVSAYREALAQDADDAWAHCGLACTYSHARRHEEAVAECQEAIR